MQRISTDRHLWCSFTTCFLIFELSTFCVGLVWFHNMSFWIVNFCVGLLGGRIPAKDYYCWDARQLWRDFINAFLVLSSFRIVNILCWVGVIYQLAFSSFCIFELSTFVLGCWVVEFLRRITSVGTPDSSDAISRHALALCQPNGNQALKDKIL